MDPSTLAETIEGYNACVAAGKDTQIAPGKELLGDAVSDPSFYASKRIPTIHYTMGGVCISPEAQVLTAAGEVIPGPVRRRRGDRRRAGGQPPGRQLLHRSDRIRPASPAPRPPLPPKIPAPSSFEPRDASLPPSRGPLSFIGGFCGFGKRRDDEGARCATLMRYG